MNDVLGARLFLWYGVAECDAHAHEVEIVTDGTRAYAVGVQRVYPKVGRQSEAIWRNKTRLFVVCDQTVGRSEHEGACGGVVEFDLSSLDSGAWRPATQGMVKVMQDAVVVE